MAGYALQTSFSAGVVGPSPSGVGNTASAPGTAGSGAGAGTTGSIGGAGTANRGGGGGGGGYSGNYYVGGVGGTDVVITRYLTGTASCTGGTITTSGSYTIHTFNSNANFVVS